MNKATLKFPNIKLKRMKAVISSSLDKSSLKIPKD